MVFDCDRRSETRGSIAEQLQTGSFKATRPAVTLEPEGQGFKINRSALTLRVEVPGLDET